MTGKKGGEYLRVDLETRRSLRKPKKGERVLVADATGFPAEGEGSFARLISDAYRLGWKQFICFGQRGQRFLGCGFGPATQGVRIDSYGSSGDYLASGIDGLEMHVHGNAQDQLGQILKAGKLVVHGDVGQTFMYSSKGGEAFVLGNAAGRPLINAVGSPRVVINGTCLDYLAESFMAGDYLNGGGFVILNGIKVEDGRIIELDTPYPGGNLFSLASGGAIFIRDPKRRVEENQLLGGRLMEIDEADWRVVIPMLERNERHFGIKVEDLLKVDGALREPGKVYRKVVVLERPKELE
jgi:glutamate synthase domain-containing protein 3